MFAFNLAGKYIGFVKNNNFYSPSGDYLGWVEEGHVWDKEGFYRGKIIPEGGAESIHILKDISFIDPPSRPKREEGPAQQEQPQKDIAALNMPFNFKDGF